MKVVILHDQDMLKQSTWLIQFLKSNNVEIISNIDEADAYIVIPSSSMRKNKRILLDVDKCFKQFITYEKTLIPVKFYAGDSDISYLDNLSAVSFIEGDDEQFQKQRLLWGLGLADRPERY